MGDSGVALQQLPSERCWSCPRVFLHPRRLMTALILTSLSRWEPVLTSPRRRVGCTDYCQARPALTSGSHPNRRPPLQAFPMQTPNQAQSLPQPRSRSQRSTPPPRPLLHCRPSRRRLLRCSQPRHRQPRRRTQRPRAQTGRAPLLKERNRRRLLRRRSPQLPPRRQVQHPASPASSLASPLRTPCPLRPVPTITSRRIPATMPGPGTASRPLSPATAPAPPPYPTQTAPGVCLPPSRRRRPPKRNQ